MKPSQLTILLQKAIVAKYPVLIKGKPGVGKTDIAEQSATAVGYHFLCMHPAVGDATDAKGMPWLFKDAKGKAHAHFVPLGEWEQILAATEPTVVMLDDLGQAPPSVQASFMRPLLTRETVNGEKIPECVTFLAASNDRTHKAGVTGILEPVKSRFKLIVEATVDVPEWLTWGYENNVHYMVTGYIKHRPGALDDFKPTADLTNSACPRTWKALSDIVWLDLPEEMELESYSGAVGEDYAGEFLAYARLMRALPDPQEIIDKADTAPIPEEISVLYALADALVHYVTKKNFMNIVTYCLRLHKADKEEYAALIVRRCMEKSAKQKLGLDATPAGTKLLTSSLGKLLLGMK